MRIQSTLLAGLLALSASSAFATTTTYSDVLSWADEVSGIITTDTFNGYDFTGASGHSFGSGTTLGGITYSTSDQFFGVEKALHYDAAYHNSNYIEWQNNVDLTITLPTYTKAIGFSFGEFNGESVTFTVKLGNGDIYTGVSASNAYSFLGAISDTAFNTLTISSDKPYPTLDNLSVGPAVASVPEPETYGMMLAGLGLMGFVASRRKA